LPGSVCIADVLESPITNDIGPDSSKASVYNYNFEPIEFS
jgi:hypothetical protein